MRYSLNTNGTLVTPATAKLLRRPGVKMVAVYGATAEVYDHVTRHPGGFAQLLQGLSYLKEAGAGFMVQLIPMRANWHQWEAMLEFARTWSRHYRVGAPWLYASACGDAARDHDIAAQRLDPADVIALDEPSVDDTARHAAPRHAAARQGSSDDDGGRGTRREPRPHGDDRVYAECIALRREFHVDPYGGMTFCSFVKDPALRYDLRGAAAVAVVAGAGRGVARAWEQFIPSLADAVHGGDEYLQGCAVCELRHDCRWCDVYGYLEHGRHGARVEHLCAVAREAQRFKEEWVREHRRWYTIAGVTVQVESVRRGRSMCRGCATCGRTTRRSWRGVAAAAS